MLADEFRYGLAGHDPEPGHCLGVRAVDAQRRVRRDGACCARFERPARQRGFDRDHTGHEVRVQAGERQRDEAAQAVAHDHRTAGGVRVGYGQDLGRPVLDRVTLPPATVAVAG